MIVRIISGLVGIGLYLALCFGGALPYAIAASVVALLCSLEWNWAYRHAARMALNSSSGHALRHDLLNPLLALIGSAYPVGLYASLRIGFHPTLADALLLAAPVILFGLLTLRAAFNGQALGRLQRWYGPVAFIYIALPMGSFVLLRDAGPQIQVAPFGLADRGAWLMLLTALCVWTEDTAAYFVGRFFGRFKLAPSLSPGKTIEGFFGGLVSALLVGALMGLWFHVPLRDGLVVGALAGLFGSLGDLWESSLKRELGIKDFGGLMPGHGGALDRFDSFLFVAPLACLYLRFLAS